MVLIQGFIIYMLNSHSEVIEQSISVLSTLSDNEYSNVCQPLFNSSIGQHIRHVIDHFENLQAGMSTQIVDYNNRSRNSKTESSIQAALMQLHRIQLWLKALTESDIQAQISVISEINVNQAHSVNVKSTVARELVFCASHAIHHYALIKLIRQIQGGVVDKHFGLAPATITYQTSN